MSGKIVLVTGANRSIGFAIVEALGRRSPDYTILVAARTKANAEEAIKQLETEKGITAKLLPVVLDVTNDAEIQAAVDLVKNEFGKLDVLVNNAGYARAHDRASPSDLRSAFQTTFLINVTSVASMVSAFEPLLRLSAYPRVINISSNRGSMARSSNLALPPTAVISYGVSKTALNALGLEYIKAENVRSKEEMGSKIAFYLACPGHCKTAFNGFKGIKDPLMGARVVVELATAEEGKYEMGFWEHGSSQLKEGVPDVMSMVPW